MHDLIITVDFYAVSLCIWRVHTLMIYMYIGVCLRENLLRLVYIYMIKTAAYTLR